MSGCPHANTSQSSQDFVRALKAVSDPPVLGGPSKIEIAQEAWDDINFYVPSKAEVIADWLLAKLLKDKGKELPSNPIFDARYWKLLTSLSSSQGPTPKTNNVGPAKSWLTTSLHRVPLGPVIVSFLTSFNDVQANERINLANSAASCLSILWPVAVQRMSAEVLQECFGAFVCKVPASKTANEGISTIGCMVSSSYRNSLINSSNKKKLYQSFLHSHLKDWLRSFSMDCTILDATLKSSLLDSGVETFFNLDILRQNLDFKTENTLVERLQSILTTDETLVLEHLPTLFIFYIHAIKRHRGALFSQSSQFQPGAALGELREAGMRYFISMLNLVDNSRRDSQAWRTRLSLLKTVDNENIFDRKQMDTQMAFNRIIELVQLALIHDLKEDQPECPDLAVQCLSIIAHIDYDLVLPFIPRLLPLFLQIPVASESHFAFLEMVLHYHTKTRTMATLVQSLFISILAQKMFRGGPHGGYQMCFSSPVMHTIYLAQVSKALQTFLTESQCLLAVQTVFDALRDTWDQFYTTSRQSEEAGESRKRRKTSSATVEVKGESDEIAVVYSLIARLASVVLSSLPIASLSSTIQDEVRSLLDGFRTDFIYHALSKSIKTIRKHGVADAWRTEVTFAATLRLLYSLNVSRILSLPPQYDEKLCTRVVELVNDDALLPELMLELFRFLLYSLSVENTLNHEVIVDRLLQYLEKNFAPSDVNWSGHGHHLTKGEPGRTESALAMMPMIIARWLPEIDRLASSEQLERLLKIILSIKMHPAGQSRQEMQPEQLLMEVLHSAQFWEFPRIRNVFLDILDKTTSALDSTHLKLPKTISILEKVSLYQHLLFFPMEYFSWQLLNDLIKRSLNADVVLSCSSSSSKQPVAEALIVLRVFLKRAYVYCGSVAQDSTKELSEFLIHLLKDSSLVDTVAKEDFNGATLDLAEVYFSKLLKASKKNGPEPVLEVLATFTADIFVNSQGITSRSFIALVDLLVREFPQSSLPEEIVAALRKLHSEISLSLFPHITSVTESNIAQEDMKTCFDLVSGWHSLLCLENWLDSNGSSAVPLIGQKLISGLVSFSQRESHLPSDETDQICVITFAILLQELEARPASERAHHLDLIVAVYISFSDACCPSALKQLDLLLGKTCRKLPLEDYVHLLSLVSDSLSDLKRMPPSQLLHLVHLAALLLHEHPSHSLMHIQKFATSCINVFTEHCVFVDGPLKLRLQVLEMVAQHCSDQQAALRSLDTAGIWLLLSKFLAPSQVHDEDTETTIFLKIIAILSSLIRLRRDLVAHALPHLGMILRQLLLCTRGCRPHLGAKQTVMVMNTQPRWISASQPLGAQEAKVLGRLLESLNTKTTVRFLGSSMPEMQKAESLAKPFSKHAAYVLKAYIEAMNDPLCILPLDVRKELQPGIFALCGMVSEYSRDSLMISALDAGGKATLKSLWKEYEKQRYVGRG